MTTLEIILSLMLYISFGMWICFKRDWYESQATDGGEALFLNGIAILCMPLNLIIIIIREFILRDWDNY